MIVTNGISFHARVGRFSPFLYLRSVAPLIPMECGHRSDFVLASPCSPRLPVFHRLVGLVVKASAPRAEGPGFESRLRRDFFGVESYQ